MQFDNVRSEGKNFRRESILARGILVKSLWNDEEVVLPGRFAIGGSSGVYGMEEP